MRAFLLRAWRSCSKDRGPFHWSLKATATSRAWSNRRGPACNIDFVWIKAIVSFQTLRPDFSLRVRTVLRKS